MTAEEIAETLINGNISDAREAIVKGHTPQEAAVLALDVASEVFALDGNGTRSWDYADCLTRVRRCVNRG